MDIIIDFVGTCVLHGFPNRCADVKGAQNVLEDLTQSGHRLILYTAKQDEKNNKYVISWFRERGLKVSGTTENENDGDLFISNQYGDTPLWFNQFISDEPFVDWQKMREILENKNFLK